MTDNVEISALRAKIVHCENEERWLNAKLAAVVEYRGMLALALAEKMERQRNALGVTVTTTIGEIVPPQVSVEKVVLTTQEEMAVTIATLQAESKMAATIAALQAECQRLRDAQSAPKQIYRLRVVRHENRSILVSYHSSRAAADALKAKVLAADDLLRSKRQPSTISLIEVDEIHVRNDCYAEPEWA